MKNGDIIIDKILFIDVETAPLYPTYDAADEQTRYLWDKKYQNLVRFESCPESSPAEIYARAGIYAEFGKVICISVGFFKKDKFYVHSFAGHDEKKLLTDFAKIVETYFNDANSRFCGHNIKEFDIPFIARRMLINGMALPKIINISGMRPWENPHLDTLDMWKFGDYKHYTSLELLATIFGIPTPKDDINGSMVYGVYWKDNDLPRIARYCEKDTITVAKLFFKLKNIHDQRLDNDENIITLK